MFSFVSCASTNIPDKIDSDFNHDNCVLFFNIVIDQTGWSISIFPRNTPSDKGPFL